MLLTRWAELGLLGSSSRDSLNFDGPARSERRTDAT
jgi:hypothetical protein